ncbi:MAG: prenyltransferase/squalene oxidase repeat-containing protein [Phycisphaerae bacterium]
MKDTQASHSVPSVEPRNRRSAFALRPLALLAMLATLGAAAFAGEPPTSAPSSAPTTTTATAADAREGIRRGLEYLLKTQNADGSWGSQANALLYLDLDMTFMNPETQRGWQVATTGLVCCALQKLPASGPIDAAYDRGIDFILNNADLKRASDWDLDPTWGLIYGLQGLANAYRHPRYDGSARKISIRDVVPKLLKSLANVQSLSGGWGYYDIEEYKTHPATWATSFTTAAGVIALLDARDAGFEVEQAIIDRAARAIERCRLPNGAFRYNVDPIARPGVGESIDAIQGSLGRIQACNLALMRAEREVKPAAVERGVQNFFQYHRFLDIARGRPIPHEAYYANAAYFYHFAHYYGARVMTTLPDQQRAAAWPRLRQQVLKTQQADGSLVDYYMNSYGKPYGTAFSLLALQESLHDEQPSEGR